MSAIVRESEPKTLKPRNARGRKTPLNNAESARISTLTAMLGRKSIYEKRVVQWQEIDV